MGFNDRPLEHMLPYDPAKAHAYYIRTRQLKGRRAAKGKPESTYTVTTSDGQTAILTGKQLVEQKAFIAKRVTEIKKSLTELSRTLKKAMFDAKAKKAKAALNAAQPPTAVDKAQAAKDSKQYREKHKQSLATKAKVSSSKTTKTTQTNVDPVAELETKITQIKSNLTDVVAKQRALAAAIKIS
jgi:hypothetical protein